MLFTFSYKNWHYVRRYIHTYVVLLLQSQLQQCLLYRDRRNLSIYLQTTYLATYLSFYVLLKCFFFWMKNLAALGMLFKVEYISTTTMLGYRASITLINKTVPRRYQFYDTTVSTFSTCTPSFTCNNVDCIFFSCSYKFFSLVFTLLLNKYNYYYCIQDSLKKKKNKKFFFNTENWVINLVSSSSSSFYRIISIHESVVFFFFFFEYDSVL